MGKNEKLDGNSNPIGFVLFRWLENRYSSRIIVGLLVASCIGLVLSDFIFPRYGHFAVEEIPGFFAVYGFIMFSLIILGATILRFFIKRNEDYYGSKAVDSEDTQTKKLKDDL